MSAILLLGILIFQNLIFHVVARKVFLFYKENVNIKQEDILWVYK